MPTQERKEQLAERIERIKKVLETTKQAMDLIHNSKTESQPLLCSGEAGKSLDMARAYLRETQKALVICKYDYELELLS